MTPLVLTEKNVADHDELYRRFHEKESALNDQVATAQSQWGDKAVSVRRKHTGGKEFEVPQSALWDEVRNLGKGCEAWADLAKLYPEMARLKDQYDAVDREIEQFEAATFGFTRGKASLPNVMRLTRALVKLELSKEHAVNATAAAATADEGGKTDADA